MKQDNGREKSDPNHKIEVYAALAERLAGGGRTYGAAILIGICAGVLFAVGGVILALLGISGAVEFVVESASLKARLTNASPGVVLAAMGMIIIWRYKPRLSHDIELGPRGLKSRGVSIERIVRDDEDDPTSFSSRGSA